MDQEIPPFADASTDHRKYSTENQAQAIHEYAAKYQIDIIKAYADANGRNE